MPELTTRTTYDCAPGLDASTVLQFCQEGFLRLDAVVDAETNARTVARLAALGERLQPGLLDEPVELFAETWFVTNVLLNPAVTGAVRSLLGPSFGLPVLISNHRVTTPAEATGWHHDGDAVFSEQTHYVQCFYYPEACVDADGPTELLPGSHLFGSLQETPRSLTAPGGRSGELTSCPAGTVFITDYPILHRRAASTRRGTRNNLKFNYFRRAAPDRGSPGSDWRPSPFQLHLADFTPVHSLACVTH